MAIVRTVYRRKRLPPRKPVKVMEQPAAPTGAPKPPTSTEEPPAQPARIVRVTRKAGGAAPEPAPLTPRQQEWWTNRVREMMAGRGERKWGDVPPEE